MNWLLVRVSIDNFKCIASAVLPIFPGLTVITGDNGTGKSTLLEAIAFGLGAGNKHLRILLQRELCSDHRGPAKVVRVTLFFEPGREINSTHYLTPFSIESSISDGGKRFFCIDSVKVSKSRFDDIVEKRLGFSSSANDNLLWYIRQKYITDVISATPEELFGVISYAAGTVDVIEAQHVATESIKKSQEHLDIISRIITSLAADVSKDERLKTSLQEYNENQNKYAAVLSQVDDVRSDLVVISSYHLASKVFEVAEFVDTTVSAISDAESSCTALDSVDINNHIAVETNTLDACTVQLIEHRNQIECGLVQQTRRDDRGRGLFHLKTVAHSIKLKNEALIEFSESFLAKMTDDYMPHLMTLRAELCDDLLTMTTNEHVSSSEHNGLKFAKDKLKQAVLAIRKLEGEIMNYTSDAAVQISILSDTSERLEYLYEQRDSLQQSLSTLEKTIQSTVLPHQFDSAVCQTNLQRVIESITCAERQISVISRSLGIGFIQTRPLCCGDHGYFIQHITCKSTADMMARLEIKEFLQRHGSTSPQQLFSQAMNCLLRPVMGIRICSSCQTAADILDQVSQMCPTDFDTSIRLWPLDRINHDFRVNDDQRQLGFQSIISQFRGDIIDPAWLLDFEPDGFASSAVRKALGNWLIVATDNIAAAALQCESFSTLIGGGFITLDGNKHITGSLLVQSEFVNSSSARTNSSDATSEGFCFDLTQYHCVMKLLEDLLVERSSLEQDLENIGILDESESLKLRYTEHQQQVSIEINESEQRLTTLSIGLEVTNCQINNFKVLLKWAEEYKNIFDTGIPRLQRRVTDTESSSYSDEQGNMHEKCLQNLDCQLLHCESNTRDLSQVIHTAQQEIQQISYDIAFAETQISEHGNIKHAADLQDKLAFHRQAIAIVTEQQHAGEQRLAALQIRKAQVEKTEAQLQENLFSLKRTKTAQIESLLQNRLKFHSYTTKHRVEIEGLLRACNLQSVWDIHDDYLFESDNMSNDTCTHLINLARCQFRLLQELLFKRFAEFDATFSVDKETQQKSQLANLIETTESIRRSLSRVENQVSCELQRMDKDIGGEKEILTRNIELAPLELTSRQANYVDGKKSQLVQMQENYDQAVASLEDLNKGTDSIEVMISGVLRTVIQSVQSRCNDIFNKLNSDGTFAIEFAVVSSEIVGRFSAKELHISLSCGNSKLAATSLSGGQRASIGVAFSLAAAVESKMPLYLLDEVDAPLDERNQSLLHAICGSIFKRSQALIVSHHFNQQHANNIITVAVTEGHGATIISKQF